ncbi:hypothetical protein EDD15DRAFT_384899 [Pisolithus albus]|nr:hypothetical protein EDD15DRAFT_384899 [Pisolithus albus]
MAYRLPRHGSQAAWNRYPSATHEVHVAPLAPLVVTLPVCLEDDRTLDISSHSSLASQMGRKRGWRYVGVARTVSSMRFCHRDYTMITARVRDLASVTGSELISLEIMYDGSWSITFCLVSYLEYCPIIFCCMCFCHRDYPTITARIQDLTSITDSELLSLETMYDGFMVNYLLFGQPTLSIAPLFFCCMYFPIPIWTALYVLESGRFACGSSYVGATYSELRQVWTDHHASPREWVVVLERLGYGSLLPAL